MSTETLPVVVSVGAGAQDNFLKPNEQVAPVYQGGAKRRWSPEAQAKFEAIEQRPQDYERHIGGNALNAVIPFAHRGWDANFLTTLGNDNVSNAIRANLAQHGVKLYETMIEGYQPSVSLVEMKHDEAGKLMDRMIHGRPRDRLAMDLNNSETHALLTRADMVLAASLKNHELAHELAFMLRRDNPNAFFVFAPGSSDFNDPEALKTTMKLNRPKIFASNREEAIELLEADERADSEELALALLEYADYVSLSDGKAGLYQASDDEVIRQDAVIIRPENFINTIGAGDRVLSLVARGLYAGKSKRVIAKAAAFSAAQVIGFNGAHGDFDMRVRRQAA